MTAYDQAFLKRCGYFGDGETETLHLDGSEREFVFDASARVAYFEGLDPDCQRTIAAERRSAGRRVDVYWFWNPDADRLAVFNRYGEQQWFVFDRSLEQSSEARRRTERRLASIEDGFETLFDGRAAVDRLARNLWDIRLDIARSFDVAADVEIRDTDRLMAAQRAIDRLVFCYLLVQHDVVHGVDDGERFSLSPEPTFARLIDGGDLYTFLTETLSTHLEAEGWTAHPVTDDLTVAFPSFDGELFRDHDLRTVAGDQIAESRLDGTAVDWSDLVAELNRYEWVIEDSPSNAARREPTETLSPAVLGHIFETFVITVSEFSDGEELSLSDLADMTVSASGGQLLAGNRALGAYYTPTYIAYENTREALWNRVRTLLATEYGVDREDIPSPDAFFGRVRRADDPFPFDLDDVETVLANMTVLDPAAGGGAFLLTAADLLETWRRQCTDGGSRAERRRDIVRSSLYGVDLLDGAVDVCQLRLWLWVTGATTIDLDADEPPFESLSDSDVTIRQGNSLLGVVEPGSDSLASHATFDWTDGEHTRYPAAVAEYRRNVRAYRAASGPEAASLRETIATQRERLQTGFTERLARESTVTVEEPLDSAAELRAVLDETTGRLKLTLDFDSAMTAVERQQVADAGFREQRNWETTAYHADVRRADPDDVDAIFDLMADRGTVRIERPITAADIADLDPFHWIFEFPTADVPADDDSRGFDVVLGNPPHGSSLSDLEQSLLAESYSLLEEGCEVAKLFVERSWTLTDGELSYVVPKASTYNSNWEDFREFCLPKLYRGLDLGKAFRNVNHEQVTIHLSRGSHGESYRCGSLPEGSYHLDDVTTIERTLAARLGTLPVSFSAGDRTVAGGLTDAGFPTVGEEGIDAGRGARTTNRISDPTAPIGYNGAQIQRYFTRAATDHVDVGGLSPATAERLESPKVMAQNIIAHVQTPYDHVVIAAVYDPVRSYSFETVTNVRLPADADLSLPALTALLNTQLVNWFVYVCVFNRAIRDMHLDRYFLDRVILPKTVTGTQSAVLEDLYGLLSASHVATEHDVLPDGRATYAALQSVTNALTYELYLQDVEEPPLRSTLAEAVGDVLGEFDVAYGPWYANHLRCTDTDAVVTTFRDHREVYETAERVVDSLDRDAVTDQLDVIADHPWVEIIERGRQRPDPDARPRFGPTVIE